MHRFCLLLIALILSQTGTAQELNALVEIQSPQVQNTNKRPLEVLKKAIEDFLNNTVWTSNTVQTSERIDCSFVINILTWDGSKEFTAQAQVFSFRPVFGSNYNTAMLSFNDRDFNFSYVEGDLLEFRSGEAVSNLSSLLAFYAHIIIGMDADSFRLNSGSTAFNKARAISNAAQNLGYKGWRSMDSFVNRYWLVNNLVDRRFAPLRDFSYQYHRSVLDKMSEEDRLSRQRAVDLLAQIKEVDRSITGNVLTPMLYTAKSDEWIGLFSTLPANERVKLFNSLSEMDAVNTNKYEVLRK